MTAFDILAARLSVLPIDPKTKRPPVKGSENYPESTDRYGYGWKAYQKRLPKKGEIEEFLERFPCCWLGFACGEGSGGVEVLDFDVPGKKAFAPGETGDAPSWEPWCVAVREAGFGDVLDSLTIVRTPSGGRQAYYRCAHPAGNSKLAHRPATDDELEENPKEKLKGLIETRGAKGLVVCPPSPGYEFVQGDLNTIPTITDESRGTFWALALGFDETPPTPEAERHEARTHGRPNGEISPGDDYDARASWEEVLEPYGYRKVGRAYGGMQLWAHPNKARGDWSARTGNGSAGDRFYSWSPNGGTAHEKVLKKYAVFAFLYHDGDFSAAVKELAAKNFGSRPKPTQRRTTATHMEDDLRDITEESDASPLGLPTIQHNARQLTDVTEEAIAALVGANDPEHLFARGGAVVRVSDDKDDRYKIETLGLDAMRNEIAKVADWVRMNDKGNLVASYPPKDVAANILAEQSLSRRFPLIEGLSSVPVLSPTEGFHRHHGYDPETKWFVTDKGPFETSEMGGAEAARFILDELFYDFPFVDDASKANVLALALLPFVRPLIQGPTPMHYVLAPQSRTGKSLVVEIALSPSIGWDKSSSSPFPEKEEELNKDISSALYEGDQLIFYDNVKRPVKSASLEQVLTANFYRFRVLGVTGKVTVPVKAIFAITLNNGTLSVDMAGRCVLIHLDAQMERPEDRGGFKHPDIRGFLRENRGNIRSALMAMIEAWHEAGRPKGKLTKASYVEWAQVMGGILDVCGVPGFLANDKNLKGIAVNEDEPWRAFYEVWWETYQSKQISSQALHELAESNKMLEDLYTRTKTERGRATAFGTALAARDGKVLDGRRPTMIKRGDGSGLPYLLKGHKQYRLQSLDSPPQSDVEPQGGLVYDPEEVDPFADE